MHRLAQQVDFVTRGMKALGTAAALSGVVTAGAYGAQAAASPQGPLEIANAGFETPESMLHDETADVYLVSNINGGPSAKDNNGFISRVSPDGTVAALRWIEGGRAGVTLHAPKGMALHDDTLYVSDIDCVRRFNRTSGAPAGEVCIEGATFLNDLAAAPDGTLYVSDTGIRIEGNEVARTGTDAVYRIGRDRRAVPLIKGAELQAPNGLAVTPSGVVLVPFGSAEVWQIDASGVKTTLGTLPAGQLDGVVRLEDGSLLVSSWEGQAVYRLTTDGKSETVLGNVASPADIGYDRKRRRLLVPLFGENRLIVKTLDGGSKEVAVLEAERRWARALVEGDVAALREIYTDDLLYVHSSGIGETREEYIGRIASGDVRYEKVDLIEPRARVFGDAAVVNGALDVAATSGSSTIAHRVIYMHVYVFDDGAWRLARHQTTRAPASE